MRELEAENERLKKDNMEMKEALGYDWNLLKQTQANLRETWAEIARWRELVLSKREIELIDGMIQVQQYHAKQCDNIQNRPMAEKQKVWDLERVDLLTKLKHGLTLTLTEPPR